MTYSCTVVRSEQCIIELDVESYQADSYPFYLCNDFALALLIGHEASALHAQLGEDAPADVAAGRVDASRFLRGITVSVRRRGSLRSGTLPVARYTIEVTDPRWVAGLPVGARWESYAWLDAGGPALAESDVLEPRVRVPAEVFAPLDRVSVCAELPATPGALHGRGVVGESAECERPPPDWQGGNRVYRITFDHGPIAWAFAESLRRPPTDSYERAWVDPERFWSELLTRAPLERARGCHFLGLRGGGALAVETEGGGAVLLESNCAWMFGLLRRLPLARAIEIATVLLEGWLTDPVARSRQFGSPTPGHELSADDTIEAYQFECCAPTAFVLGALTMLFAEHRVRAPAVVEASLQRVLSAVPSALFGHSSWNGLAAYPRAACGAVPPAMPAWLLHGHRPDGVADLWISPSDEDLYRP